MTESEHKKKWWALIRAKVDSIDVLLSTKLCIFWRRIRPYFGVSALLFSIVYFAGNFLFGSIPWLSLLQKLLYIWNLQIELVGLPKVLLAEYQRLRAVALRHVIEFLQLAIPIPGWVVDIFTTWMADILIIYMLFALSVVRGSAINRRHDQRSLRRDREAFEKQLRSAAELHHLDETNLIERVEGGLKAGFFPWLYFQWRAWRSGLRWPIIIRRNILQVWHDQGADNAKHLLTVIAVTFACALAGVIFYLLLSYLSKA